MTRLVRHPQRSQFFLFVLGLFLRSVNKVRHSIIGYTPRPFSYKDIDRSVEYCLNVVKNWERALTYYSGKANPFSGKHVVELGPGSDLGTGIVILALGAESYTSIDKHKLIHRATRAFYHRLLASLEGFKGYQKARAAVNNLNDHEFNEYFQYLHDPDFNLKCLTERKFDTLVSQAVLEHILDIKGIFCDLYNRLNSDAVMVHEVDLGAHTGLLRELDPLNHLRYSDTVWNLLRFDGSPNRFSMTEYRRILEQLDFKRVETRSVALLDNGYVKRTQPHLLEKFRGLPEQDIGTKSFYLLASKK